ncbi:MAG: 23S rRNA (adenine(2503)-C(2))-methyltransferase RlmN [Bacteroidales bacterium]|jgi:23S rRNA (adenine2503-C2)-methyltransferase|nr:23S rRNA (adenine(2503)-C(2))-methyltransferase RlmN [Bacteroidales bacterium]
MDKKTKDIRDLSLDEINHFITQQGEKAFRAKQIDQWLWKNGAREWNDMKNIPNNLLEKLSENFHFKSLSTLTHIVSTDGTTKFLFETHDKKHIEGVLIFSRDRVTACISTQIGCALNCGFCATGKLGLYRDLSAGEIFDQIILMNEHLISISKRAITNIVVMGMGEAFLNFENSMKALEKITLPKYLGMSPRRITVSTAGVADGIRKFADLNSGMHLALSLHTADETLRREIMPVTKSNPFNEIIDALKYFHQKTGERITMEYLLLKDVNDSLEQAKALAEFCKNFPVKINIINYNSTDEADFKASSEEQKNRFVKFLESKNIIVNIRASKGDDIAAACGQLALKNKK